MRLAKTTTSKLGALVAVVPVLFASACLFTLDQTYHITVQTTTTGEDLPETYTAVVGGWSLHSLGGGWKESEAGVGANDAVRFGELGSGEYQVYLRGLPTNCENTTSHMAWLTTPNPDQWGLEVDLTGDDTATFTVLCTAETSAAPVVGIDAPAADSHFPHGQPVEFLGTAQDSDGRTLTEGSLVWTSDLMNGPIGTGTEFTTSDLAVGYHTITLTATDMEGATGTADVGVWIDAAASCAGLEPVADTYVRGGSFADSSFGMSSSLLIKGIMSLDFARKAYLVFDVSTLPASFASATLQLTLNRNTGLNPREVTLYGIIDNDDWDLSNLAEGSITWNNAPRNVTTSGIAFEEQGTTAADGVRVLAMSKLDNTDPSGTTYGFDITDFVRWALGKNLDFSDLAAEGDTDGRITLLLAHSAEITGDNGPTFWSREAAEACNRPQLIVQ